MLKITSTPPMIFLNSCMNGKMGEPGPTILLSSKLLITVKTVFYYC